MTICMHGCIFVNNRTRTEKEVKSKMIRNIIKLNFIIRYPQKSKYSVCTNRFPLIKYLNKKFSTLPNATNENESTTDTSSKTIDREKMLKIFYLEIDVARHEGRRVPDPDSLKEPHWDYLLSLKSRSARTKYYSYLWQLEKKRESTIAKKLQKSQDIVERKARLIEENEANKHIIYGINHTTFLLRVYDATINLWHNNKVVSAMQFAPKMVLDCGYDEHMNKREALNTAKQLMLVFADNRFNDEPFDLHFCNANFNETVMCSLKNYIPTMLEPSFPLNVHEKCFSEVFPKERIVYLTPHCNNELTTYNHDDIYVIGAIVDKVNNEPVSLAKAKKLGLRMARLPLDRYLSWGSGSGKSLTLDQMIKIMLDIKRTGDWNFSLRHVPRRKLADDSDPRRRRETIKVRAKKFEFDVDTWGDLKSKDFQENPFKK